MTVPAPTVGRFVQVNIAARGQPSVWRPALVVQDWPSEFLSHPACTVGLNVQVFLDGFNDAHVLRTGLAASYAGSEVPHQELERIDEHCRRGLRWETSLPHEALLGLQPEYRGMVWRWPPREGA